jgi:hypothetical protein
MKICKEFFMKYKSSCVEIVALLCFFIVIAALFVTRRQTLVHIVLIKL